MTQRVKVNPEMLKWARMRAGLSIESAAKKSGLSNSKSSTAVMKLELLESGEISPSFQQFLKFAKIYQQSSLVFLLNEPPVISDTGVDVGQISSKISDEEMGRLNALIVDVQTRQNLVKEILQEDKDFKSLEFVGSLNPEVEIIHGVNRIRELLDFSTEGYGVNNFKTTNELFMSFRNKIERIGVFVLLKGNLGSYHSNINESVFQGYAISDAIAPFIVINENSSVKTQLLTLIFEFVQILIGQQKVALLHDSCELEKNQNPVEKFCSIVAGEFLLPVEKIKFEGNPQIVESVRKFIENVAAENLINEALVTNRMWQTGKIGRKTFKSLLDTFSSQRQEMQNVQPSTIGKSAGGSIYYAAKRHRLGNAIVSLVRYALQSNVLTHTKAAIVLGVKPTTVELILDAEM